MPLLIKFFVDDKFEDDLRLGSVRDKAFKIISKKQMLLISQKFESVKPDKAIFEWDYVDSHFGIVTTNIRPLFMALEFGCRNNTVLEEQISAFKKAFKAGTTTPNIDGRLLKKNDKKYEKKSILLSKKVTVTPYVKKLCKVNSKDSTKTSSASVLGEIRSEMLIMFVNLFLNMNMLN